MAPKRKQLEGEAEEQNEQLRGNQASEVVLVGGMSCSTAALRAIRKPFKVRPRRRRRRPPRMVCNRPAACAST